MKDIHLISEYIIIGIYIYAGMTHGIMYFRVKKQILHGIFALLCIFVASYSLTNIFALYYTENITHYIFTSKLSSEFVILSIISLTWFCAEYIQDYKRIPLKIIALLLVPFFLINIVAEYGVLWKSIDGIEQRPGISGIPVNKPLNAELSILIYFLMFIIVSTYILILRATYLARKHQNIHKVNPLLIGLIILLLGFINDSLIDTGYFQSEIYLSEYILIGFALIMSIDLSDRMRQHELKLETLVNKRTETLKQANEDLESFSYSISHDLRAPLRAIKGYSNALNEDIPDNIDKNIKDYLDRIINNVTRMESMIIGLLQLSKLSRKEIKREMIDLTRMANDVANEIRDDHPGREVHLTIEEGLKLYGDPTLVKILLVNLIENACKFTKNMDNPKITIKRFTTELTSNSFVIEDNGAGFDPDMSSRLFTPFQRLHSAKDYPGIGIGLATVARIVNKHNGKINAEGDIEKGAKFFISLS